MSKDNNLNIMVVGKTGVGKSTLINAVFGKEIAKTASGESITQVIKRHTDDKGLSIYDINALSVNEDDTIKMIEHFISDQESKDPSEHIHLAWVCISEGQRRIEITDVDLFNLFKNNGIPVMIVITKASQDKDEYGNKFSDKIKEVFSIKDDQCQRVRALAIADDDGNIPEVRGIKELMDKSLLLLESGRQNAHQRCNIPKRQEHNKQMAKEHALSLITKYSAIAGTIATTPIPFSDIALLLPAQGAMITHINSIYGVKMDKDGALKTAAAFLGIVATGFAMRYAVGSALKFIPAIGTLAGGMLNAVVAAETTTLMGKVYITFLDDHYDFLDDILSKIDSKSLEPYKDKASNL